MTLLRTTTLTQKFDSSIEFYKPIAYLNILNSLNYKWYKSGKRKWLLPNYYFIKFFLKNLKNISKINSFKKNIQPYFFKKTFYSLVFFEKRMFNTYLNFFDFLEKQSSDFFLLNTKFNKHLINQKNFFQVAYYPVLNNQTIFLKNDVNLKIEDNVINSFFVFEKKIFLNLDNKNFDFNFPFFIGNFLLKDIYSLIILFYFYHSNFK